MAVESFRDIIQHVWDSVARALRVVLRPLTLTTDTGTVSASGDTTLIAAPGASYRLVVTSFVIQNESSTATTMILKDGSTNKRRVLGQNQGDGLAMVFAPGSEWRLSENAALVLNLSGANQCGYTVDYFTEAV